MPNLQFAPTREDTHQALVDAARRWAGLSQPVEVSIESLEAAYATIHQVAEDRSGTTLDAPRRAVIYFSIYEDSQGNFMFPLVATHGSLWGVHHTLRIERGLQHIAGLSRHGRINRWIEAFDRVRDINRRVFVEIYSTFYFTRYYGQHPRAGEIIKPDVLEQYNRVHKAISSGVQLTEEERRDVYYTIFVHEQEDIVDPGIQEAAAASGSPYLVRAFRRVRPRFRYFPRGRRLKFTDFTSIDQRNREGLRALAWAEAVGSERVLAAMSEYDLSYAPTAG